MNLHRLIYKSIAHSFATTDAALKEIELQAATKNKRLDICGVLFFSNKMFLQILEGETEDIKTLYKSILMDERHHDVELLTYEEITQPEFNYWSMRVVNMDKVDRKYRELLEKNRQLLMTEKHEVALQAQVEIKKVIDEMHKSIEANSMN